MSFTLEIPKTASTPHIYINESEGYIKFEGESFHENVISFYKDVNHWLDEFLKLDFTELTFDCALAYFNSSTAKLLYNMLLKMNQSAAQGKKVTINWITTEENDILIECGEDFREELPFTHFNIIKNDVTK